MSLIVVILVLILLFVILTFATKAKVVLSADINEMKMSASLFWLYPFIRADFAYKNVKPFLSVYLFKIRIYKAQLKAGEKGKSGMSNMSKTDMVRSISLSDVDVQASYGFQSPFTTGIFCGILGMVAQYVEIDHLEQRPDFIADDDYIIVNATANLNIGSTVLNLLRASRKSSAPKLHTQTLRGG